MKKHKLHIIGIAALSLSTYCVQAQDISQKSYYSFERLVSKTPWLVSGNSAGLTYNSAENFSTVGGYYNNQSGSFRNFNEAKEYQNFGLQTESYSKKGNLFFYGNFNYDYGIKTGQSWLGTIYPNATLNPICDSVPGKVLREDYILNGKVGYTLSPKFAIGVGFDYHAATAAKRTDGRNGNTMSSLAVSPGVSFTSGMLKAGLNLSYGHDVEKVTYTYIGDPTGKKLYYFEGLWFYTSSALTSSSLTDRGYFKDFFGGAVQLDLQLGKLRFYNELNMKYGSEDDYEEINLTKRFANVLSLDYDYKGILSMVCEKMDHYLRIRAKSNEMLSYAITNIYEAAEGEVNQWKFVEHGKTLRYTQESKSWGVEYSGFVKKSDWLSSFVYTIGVNFGKQVKKQKIYPAEYCQTVKRAEYYADITKNITFSGTNMIDINVFGAIAKGDGTLLDENNPLVTGLVSLHRNILNQDYAYTTADSYKVGANLKYRQVFNTEKGYSGYLKVGYAVSKVDGISGQVTDYYKNLYDGTRRGFFSCALGFNF